MPESAPKEDRILAAALELFAERGFHGTAVPLVAEKAGVGAGTVYRYFASKEALVNALFQRWKSALAAALLTEFPTEAPVRAQFKAFWQRMTRFAQRHPRALAFLELHHHGSYLDAESRAAEAALLEPMIAFIKRAQRDKVLKLVDPATLMVIIYGAFVGLVRAARDGKLTLTRERLDAAEACLWEAIRR